MDNRTLLQDVIKNFSPHSLTTFFRSACGSFRSGDQDFGHLLNADLPIQGLLEIGRIEFSDERRLMVVVAQMQKELTSRSGKKKQYDLAKKILKDELFDAGIFTFYDDDGNFRFSLVVAKYHGQRRSFSDYRRFTYYVSPDFPNRTFLDQIGQADFDSIDSIHQAFSVEPVTKEFFKVYENLFRKAEASITLEWDVEQKTLYTQKFFNRLVFLTFLEQKGWLRFGGRTDYIRAVFDDYWNNDNDKRPEANFHRKRLNTLFFWGLNNPRGDERDKEEYKSFRRLIGDVPFLNGGLFEKEANDETWFFSDEIVSRILVELIYRFNFTVAESTPMDIEVAVDPEMLGKMFEEMVTGRHETGSYYTPKPVVAFMCREAIKTYLSTALPKEDPIAIHQFVDEIDPAGLRNPEFALFSLQQVKACDLACGSGAYLLGLLHELLDLRASLFASRNLDPQTIYERKMEIIQNNLYGVDIDPFAVNIARLRLWLSLIVDYEGDNPPPLPNLDFKIEAGDSLTATDPSGGLQPDLLRYNQVQRFLKKKNEYLSAHTSPDEKQHLTEEIKALRDEIAEWAHTDGSEGFDWVVDFAEIFAPQLAEGTLSGKFTDLINTVPGQMELTEKKRDGGFDIILTNPPYVRQELITSELGANYKERLKALYPEAYIATADLYVAFYARAHQLLCPDGVGCFISSNKWLRAGYGEELRVHLIDKQAFQLVVDFGELPVFQTASTFPAIFLWQKRNRGESFTKWARVKDLDQCYSEGILEHVDKISEALPATQFGKGKPRFISPKTNEIWQQIEMSGQRLGSLYRDQMFNGVKTGLNDAFVIDKNIRNMLLEKDPDSSQVIKPFLKGDDIRGYELTFRDLYLIYIKWDSHIDKYPAILEWLLKFRDKLENRDGVKNGGPCPWFALSRPRPEASKEFCKPKILYPLIAMEQRFVLDTDGFFTNNSIYFIARNDYFLLSILNSSIAWEYLKLTCAILGDENARGRLQLTTSALEKLPIPNAPQKDREILAQLSQKTQALHNRRRRKVEVFLHAIGTSSIESNSRNLLETPWLMSISDFTNRARRYGTPNTHIFIDVRDETIALTKQIEIVEAEIDELVASLYGVDIP